MKGYKSTILSSLFINTTSDLYNFLATYFKVSSLLSAL